MTSKRRKVGIINVNGTAELKIDDQSNEKLSSDELTSSDTKSIVSSVKLLSTPNSTQQESNIDQANNSKVNTNSDAKLCQNGSNCEHIVSKKLTPVEIRKRNVKLDMELRKLRLQLQNTRRAKNINEKGENEKLDELILKWRDVAQKASNYLLNEAAAKVNRSGGMKEYSRREKEKLKEQIEYSIDSSFQDRLYEITESYQYKILSEKEKENILEDLEKEQEKALEQAEKSFIQSEDDEREDDEFSMKDLYKMLKLDYKLVYPDS